jgi:phage gp36-like protein
VAYCTILDLRTAFGDDELLRIADRGNPPGVLLITDPSVTSFLQALIDQSTADIDSYIGRRHDPIVIQANVPLSLKRKAIDIVRYYLYERRLNDTVINQYQNALSWLKGIAAGSISLGISTDQTQPQPVATSTQQSSQSRVFSRDSLRRF